MDIPSAAWLSELEMDETEFMNQQQMMKNHYSDSVDSFSSKSFTDNLNGDLSKHRASPFTSNHGSSSNSFTISFGNPNAAPEFNPHEQYGRSDLKSLCTLKLKEEMSPDEFCGLTEGPKRGSTTGRNRKEADDHVLAERKRREKLSERFVSLSALLPELKKMDKASVLEDASQYIKQLQTRVKELEETSIKAKSIIQESVVSIRRSKLCVGPIGDHTSSSDECNSLFSGKNAFDPEIEVRISGNTVLVRIYCQKNPTLVMKALIEIERLHLSIISSSTLPFSQTALLITITAQMGDEFLFTAMDLVKGLQLALTNFL